MKCGRDHRGDCSGILLSVTDEGYARILPYNGMPINVHPDLIEYYRIPQELLSEEHDQKAIDDQKATAPINANLAGKGGGKNNEKRLFEDPRLASIK